MTVGRLGSILQEIGAAAVAVSGGVDSMTLAEVAHRTLGDRAVMFHATSPAVPPEATARVFTEAAARGWRVEIFDAGEFADARYRANPLDRCFYCKINLYGAIARRTRLTIVSGTNTDDLGEYRPGLEAAREHGVRHPFVEAGMNKQAVRATASALGLGEIAALPAAPCLASRVETGIPILASTLGVIHEAERLVAGALSPATVRCRVRAGGVVIELDPDSLAAVTGETERRVRRALEALLDRAGILAPIAFAPYRTGSAFVGIAS